MNQTLTTKIDTLVGLLVESVIADEVKDVLIQNAEKLTPELIDGIIASLTREQVELADIETMIRDHDAIMEHETEMLEQERDEIVRKLSDKFVMEALREHIQKGAGDA